MTHIHSKLFLSGFLVLLLSTGSFAQLPSNPFIAYNGNPVISKIVGQWDSGEIFWPYVTFINDTFYITYNGIDYINNKMSIGLATSSDGYNFSKSDSNPILQADSSGFDSHAVTQGLLYYSNSVWFLYYSGRSSTGNIPGTVIGSAVSNTGPHGPWLRADDTLLTVGSPEEWDSEIIGVEAILEINSELVMYYWACDTWPGMPSIGRATSTNSGYTWIKYDDPTTTEHPYRDSDPVLKPDRSYDICGIFGCTIFKLDSIWEMYYGGSISGCAITKINYATSVDGIVWDKDHGYNPIFSPSQDTASQSPIREKPAVIKFDSIYYMYYDYGVIGSNAIGIGLATADIITSVKVLNENIPATYTLEQNYPNPFNPSTTIQYSIKERASVELVLYDVLGRQLLVLVNEEQDAGYYKVNFNAGRLASGVYLYRLQAGDFIQTKKMILMK